MGWERRGKDGKRLIYYRKKQVGKRVFSVYVGSGEVGKRAERDDCERRESVRRIVSEPSEAPRCYKVLHKVLRRKSLLLLRLSPEKVMTRGPDIYDGRRRRGGTGAGSTSVPDLGDLALDRF
jgi:hypothetical protein